MLLLSIPLDKLPCKAGLGEAVKRRKFAAAGNMSSPHFSIIKFRLNQFHLCTKEWLWNVQVKLLRCLFDNPDWICFLTFINQTCSVRVLSNLQMQFLNKFLFHLMLRISVTKPACTQPSLPGHKRPFRQQGSTESRLSPPKLQRDSIPAESSFSQKWSDSRLRPVCRLTV